MQTFSQVPMPNGDTIVAYYLDCFRHGDFDSAFHGLIEQDHAILPHLTEAFRVSSDTSLRVFLMRVIWQHRQQCVMPLLAEALFDPQSEVWKEAMDGLVALASAQSLKALRLARTRTFEVDDETREFREWLEEAIDQTQAQLES